MRPAIGLERVPVVVDFFLCLDANHERHAPGKFESGLVADVVAREPLPVQNEICLHGVRAQNFGFLLEDREVVLCDLFAIGVEHDKGRDRVRRVAGILQARRAGF
ncbi:MAG: hypothetical protein LDLANPLL_00930 [Turneriella sp.]|nr:hypothetical protein [Turneriella sp.]